RRSRPPTSSSPIITVSGDACWRRSKGARRTTRMADPSDAPLQFQLRMLGHAISDRYPDSMVPGGMVFMRCNADHHGVALVGGARQGDRSSLNHFAFEVATLDEV